MSGWDDGGRVAGGRGNNTNAARGYSSKGKPKQDRSWDKRQPEWQAKGAWRFQTFPPGKTCVFDASNLKQILAFPRHLIKSLPPQPVARVTLSVPIRGVAEMDVRLLDSRIVAAFYNPQKIDLFEILLAIPKNVEAFLASARDFGMERGEFYFDKAKMNAHEVETYHARRHPSEWNGVGTPLNGMDGVAIPRFWTLVAMTSIRASRSRAECFFAAGMDNDDLVATRALFDPDAVVVSSDRDFCMYRDSLNKANTLIERVFQFLSHQRRSKEDGASNASPKYQISPDGNVVLQPHLIQFYPKLKKPDKSEKIKPEGPKGPKGILRYRDILKKDADTVDSLRSRDMPFLTNRSKRHVLLMHAEAWPFHAGVDLLGSFLPLRLAVYEKLLPDETVATPEP